MSKFRCFVSSALLTLAGLGAARADGQVLVPGDPPLTQSMVDDYCRYVAWRWPQAFANVGGSRRLGQLVVNDWKNGDRDRQRAVLAELNWWREDFPKLAPAERERLAGRGQAPGPSVSPLPQAPGEGPRLSARDQEAIHMLRLRQRHDAQQLQIRAISNLQASHHDTMMLIIDNMRPTGRYGPYPYRR